MTIYITDRVATIYKATNIVNGKVYIGFTSYSIEKRIINHKCRASACSNLNNKFYNAIRKHGWESFVWEVIYQSKDVTHTHDVMESYFIKEYDSYDNGYNSTSGGDGGDFNNLSSTMKTIWNNNTDRKERLIERNVKQYIVTDPAGLEYTIINLKKFCIEQNLSISAHSNLVHVAKGRYKQYHGWKCRYSSD
jgi:group I intron endonuclease